MVPGEQIEHEDEPDDDAKEPIQHIEHEDEYL
jgi:hypothetical protein